MAPLSIVADIQNLARHIAFQTDLVDFGRIGGRKGAVGVHAHLTGGLGNEHRADDINAQVRGKIQCGGPHESFQPGVDHGCRGGARPGIAGQHPGCQGDRTTGADMMPGSPHQVHLPHEFVLDTESEIIFAGFLCAAKT